MQRLYNKLKGAGYSRSFARSMLPEWWDDAIADDPAGYQQAALLLARLFSVKPETLWREEVPAELAIPLTRKFKQRANTTTKDFDVACALARSAARLVLHAYRYDLTTGFLPDAATLRSSLLSGKDWITFADLLNHCLCSGIPVIFLAHFPSNAKKMAGVTFELEGRPIIVLTHRKPHGHLLFDLAHELGHITLGHTKGGAMVVDQTIDSEADDEDEKAANRFALELITGNPECKIVPTGKHLFANQLANSALRLAQTHKIDPLHIALNYAHNSARWGVATEAVKLIAKDATSDQDILTQALLAAIDNDAIKEDDLFALKRLMGGDPS
jgi:Zn-dependent peptidase ImmA (M78 family)